MSRESRAEETGIPVSDALAFLILRFIRNIETVAGGTEKGAGTAADAFLMDPVPEGTFHHLSEFLLYPFTGTEASTFFEALFSPPRPEESPRARFLQVLILLEGFCFFGEQLDQIGTSEIDEEAGQIRSG